MKPNEAKKLGAHIKRARVARALSQNRLAEKVGVPNSTILRLERGENLNPRPDLLALVANELHIDLADLYSMAGYESPSSLPSLHPYLRSKYRELPASATDEIAAYAARLMKKHGVDLSGPAPGEDEAPEPVTATKRTRAKKGGTR
jgi:transcriptional regulator with XRE-family HTH domain